MPIRPVDSEQLADICRAIALENYGFLYVDREKDKVQTRYEGAETSLVYASSISGGATKATLREQAGDDLSEFQQIRTGVYYCDPFGSGDGESITTQLTGLFDQRLVVTTETLRSRFGLAIDDVDFFASELEDRDLVRRITAGDRDYYTIGSRLKEHAGEAGVDSQLRRRARHGKITHEDLESAIDVAATTDVIRYLEREGFVVDLDGEYLVRTAMDDYGAHLASDVSDGVAEEFEEAGHVMPQSEYESVVRNAVDDRFDVLSRLGASEKATILETVREQLRERLDLEVVDGMVREREAFDEFVDRTASQLVDDQLRERVPASVSAGVEQLEDDIAEVSTGTSASVDEHVREALRERCTTHLEAEFATGSEN